MYSFGCDTESAKKNNLKLIEEKCLMNVNTGLKGVE